MADSATKLSVLKKNTVVDFVACVSNSSWVKPTIDEQALRLQADERFGSFEDDERERFVAPFWREGLEAGWAMTDYSGLWRIEDAGLDVVAIANAGCPDFKDPHGRTQVNVWLLNHQADAADIAEGRLVVQVRSKKPGFQMIQVRTPRGTKPSRLPVDFIDNEGRVLQTIAPDMAWSRLPNASEMTGRRDIVP